MIKEGKYLSVPFALSLMLCAYLLLFLPVSAAQSSCCSNGWFKALGNPTCFCFAFNLSGTWEQSLSLIFFFFKADFEFRVSHWSLLLVIFSSSVFEILLFLWLPLASIQLPTFCFVVVINLGLWPTIAYSSWGWWLPAEARWKLIKIVLLLFLSHAYSC